VREYDVIVVGAGFGGPVAAKKCAEAGLATLMLERSAEVGEKVISGLTIPFYGFLFGPSFIRDGNPPVERPVDGIINYIIKDIDAGDIDIDDSLKVPRPFSPIFSFGYNAYCKPFCQWEADRAVESGVELRTSTTVVDVIRDGNGAVCGVVTDSGERIPCRLVIDAEGSQGLLAIRLGCVVSTRPRPFPWPMSTTTRWTRRTWTASSGTRCASAGAGTSSRWRLPWDTETA
jgi:flavin-dependent dehydrogenase